MGKIKDWVRNKAALLTTSKRIRIGVLLFGVIVLSSSVLVAGAVIKRQANTANSEPTPVVQVESSDGEVAGATTEVENTPTPTPLTTRRATATPSPTPTPATTNNQPSSNNNQSSDNSSNNSSQQPQNNTTNQTSSPTPTPTLIPTQEPTPTPDNTPFEAEWNVSWNGDSVSVVITANKPLQSCEGDIKVTSGTTVVGSTSINGNVCTFGGGTSKCHATVWAKATSTNDETKEFSQLRSNVDPC
ncbi:hypothetical protein A2115_00535 [Candidatus Woesebacteria bacterium GWA1_41_8]|uniref:Uncharacterized protein n=1 Tax=Candidatus Woesebacteria bacterium GWA1_41_8 TaxID=1802471 RepID=A0A1F7WII9_9BACT|nr:MAG: hypothetical protein A2115_00535 [Candidatus Woesebacteria bacterium GWA1_41_8]